MLPLHVLSSTGCAKVMMHHVTFNSVQDLHCHRYVDLGFNPGRGLAVPGVAGLYFTCSSRLIFRVYESMSGVEILHAFHMSSTWM